MSGSENFLKPHQLYLPSCEPERGQGKEEVAVVAGVPAHEVGRIRGRFTVRKYKDDIDSWVARYGEDEGMARFFRDCRVEEEITASNVVTTQGAHFLWLCSIGQGVTPASSGVVVQNIYNFVTRYSGCIGVGDGGGSLPSVSASDSDLTASSNYVYVNLTSAPSVTTNAITCSATFSGARGNFAWREIILANAAASTIASSYPQWAQGLGETTTGKISSTPGTASYSLISHLASSLGTKATGSTWSISWTCTIS